MQIPISNIPFTPILIQDFLNQKESLEGLYGNNNSQSGIIAQSELKGKSYSLKVEIAQEIELQMQELELSKKQINHLQKLKENNTRTITTGHQLNLLTGPIYSIYKILQVIKTCDELNKLKNFHYVPIFWMATEDHDFLEINHCNFFEKSFDWNTKQKGAVGRFSISEIQPTISEILKYFENYPYYKEIKAILEQSYSDSKTLAEAHRKLIHLLFKDFGLLIIDGDSKNLKKNMIPFFKKELLLEEVKKETASAIEQLEKNHYKIQVAPRSINLFYLSDKGRNRIEKQGEKYYIIDTDVTFTEEEIVKELEQFPEKFSPNALLRPFYQEVILPNIMYIGGNAEVAYWLELKPYFDAQNIPFPILVPRNSVVLYSEKERNKLRKLRLKVEDFLKPKLQTEKTLVNNFSMVDLGLDEKSEQIEKLYDDLIKQSLQTDSTLKNLLEAQKTKQLKAFEKVSQRLLKAEKRVQSQKINSFNSLYEKIFPLGTFQERQINYFQYFAIMGPNLMPLIYKHLNTQNPVLNFVEI